ncbi:hypothetical protein HanIR_Chr14g0692631 [Helianthus annuus]|nr:hypothetical protein HanIR_Chr14g0692631 [Helianthus annuus]
MGTLWGLKSLLPLSSSWREHLHNLSPHSHTYIHTLKSLLPLSSFRREHLHNLPPSPPLTHTYIYIHMYV